MKKSANKTSQLQIRVSPEQKAQIAKSAKVAGMSMSDWVLAQALKNPSPNFQNLVAALSQTDNASYVLADINDFLTRLSAQDLMTAVKYQPEAKLDPYLLNYLTAMVEEACVRKKVKLPDWCKTVQPLAEPRFISDMNSLRMHLLLNSPPPFRNRNIFIDSSIGDRV